MITTGAQIKAARAFLGMRRDDLAAVAGVHPNAVKYWEDRPVPSGPLPYAVERIAKALRDRGVEVFADPKPGVRLVA
jgi:DNA-binding transcriptional regulator YiaG